MAQEVTKPGKNLVYGSQSGIDGLKEFPQFLSGVYSEFLLKDGKTVIESTPPIIDDMDSVVVLSIFE